MAKKSNNSMVSDNSKPIEVKYPKNDFSQEATKLLMRIAQEQMSRSGEPFALMEIPVEAINIDESYQRPIDWNRVEELSKHFDPKKVDIKSVNFRKIGRRYYIFIMDGQNTLETVKKQGKPYLICKSFVGLTLEEEAALFAEQDNGKKKVSLVDKFKAEVVAQKFPAVDIKNLCDEMHIQINAGNYGKIPAGSVTSVRMLYCIVKHGGIDCLRYTFEAIQEIGWDTIESGYSESCLNLYHTYKYVKDNPALYKALIIALKTFNGPDHFISTAMTTMIEEQNNHGAAINRNTKHPEKYVKGYLMKILGVNE